MIVCGQRGARIEADATDRHAGPVETVMKEMA
jgi:hypothetical protein